MNIHPTSETFEKIVARVTRNVKNGAKMHGHASFGLTVC